MPYNGSGTFTRLFSWVVDAANSVNISSTRTDAEMNGFAAGLTNCITRDGQSPPSADIPWGAKKITNLGAATVGTDALNRDTADTRYILTGTSISGGLTFTDSTAARLSLTKTGTGAGTALINNDGNLSLVSGASGQAIFYRGDGHNFETFSSTLIATLGSSGFSLVTNGQNMNFTDANAGSPHFVCQNDNNFVFYGTDASGAARGIWSVFMHSGTSTLNLNVQTTTVTPSAGDNSTKLATTAFIATSFAPLASPPLTGTPTAPTAAAGTATTQLATTAFADRLRDVPSNAQTASYALALTDRGGGVDFNGTSLTCTIPANASVAFPIGTVILITNLNASNLSIAITTDTLTLSGTTTTGTRTLGQNGEARIRKVGATSWIIAGTALS